VFLCTRGRAVRVRGKTAGNPYFGEKGVVPHMRGKGGAAGVTAAMGRAHGRTAVGGATMAAGIRVQAQVDLMVLAERLEAPPSEISGFSASSVHTFATVGVQFPFGHSAGPRRAAVLPLQFRHAARLLWKENRERWSNFSKNTYFPTNSHGSRGYLGAYRAFSTLAAPLRMPRELSAHLI